MMYIATQSEPSFVRHNMKRSKKFEADDGMAQEKEQVKRKNSAEDYEDPFEDEFEDEHKFEGEEGDWEDVEDE